MLRSNSRNRGDAAVLLKFLRRLWTRSHGGFAEEPMLDARRARLLATMAAQAASARAARAAARERAEDALIVAERERRAAAMPAVAQLVAGTPDVTVDRALAETGRWGFRVKPRRVTAYTHNRARPHAGRSSSAN
jgi:hypothetical protein